MEWLAWLIASISVIVCLRLWMRNVYRIMQERQSTVESAASQLAGCREKALQAGDDPAAAAILERSEDIYRQSVEIYNRTLQKPGNYLPAILMGFRRIDHISLQDRTVPRCAP